MTGLLLLAFAIVAGAFLPMQAGVNATLAKYVGGAVRASFVSFTIGAIVLLVVVALFYRGEHMRAGHAPWWAWVGGALGAFYVTSTVVVPPRMGAAAFFGILVAAQLVMSVLADQFGWLAFEQRTSHRCAPLALPCSSAAPCSCACFDRTPALFGVAVLLGAEIVAA